MHDKHRGSLAELQAAAWLLQQGFEVFRNVSQHGGHDLAVYDPSSGKTELVDVTTGHWKTFPTLGATKVAFPATKLRTAQRVLIVVGGSLFLWDDDPRVHRPVPKVPS